MLKKIGLTIASVVLAYNSIKLVMIFFELSPGEFSTLANIILAIALNIMITGIFAFLGFAYPTNKILPESYYIIKNTNLLKRIYNLFGVRYFKMLLLNTFYRKEDNKKYFNGTKTGILLFDYNTKQSEFGHLMAFISVFIISIILLFIGHTTVFFWILPINIILNFYPIILQRKHRIQIERLIKSIK